MINKKPLITVATITYNSANWVKETIESVLASSYFEFEFLISDDCSQDNTWDIVKRYRDPRIRSWRNEINLGEYQNRNKILNEATGEYIYFLDGDDFIYKNTLLEYVNYINFFPEADAIWGVHTCYFDFVAFPYLFTPEQLTALNFLSLYPITSVGFTESLFKIKELKLLGGFDHRFAIGDTYIKRKFSTLFSVLLIPTGKAFWRQYDEQASNRVRSNYRNLCETYNIDKELLYKTKIPLGSEQLEQAKLNFRIRSIKLIILNIVRKKRFFDFFTLMKKLQIPFTDLKLIFIKGNYNYKSNASGKNPLKNDYNF